MAEAHEHLEHAEHAEHAADPFDKRVAVSIAIVAALLAGISMLGHRKHNEVLQLQGDSNRYKTEAATATVESSNAFAWFQAKRLRQSQYQVSPELATLLPVLYPNSFPHLAALKAKRVDLVAILLTGLPKGIIPGFQNNTGKVLADMLRLNVAIPPTTRKPSPLGLLGNDLAGFPNGRRVFDDIVNIELRAIAGLTYPLVNPSYTPDDAASKLTQGLTPGSHRYQSTFPYLGTPHDGFHTPS